jgi:hypothetical protein
MTSLHFVNGDIAIWSYSEIFMGSQLQQQFVNIFMGMMDPNCIFQILYKLYNPTFLTTLVKYHQNGVEFYHFD